MGTETNKEERNTPEYLAQLLKDKKQIQAFPNVFLHLERLLDEGKFQWRKMDAPEILLVFTVVGQNLLGIRLIVRRIISCYACGYLLS